MSRNEIIHQIATKAAMHLVQDTIDAGLDWSELLVACETVATIVIAYICETKGPNTVRLATELMESMTRNAHVRVTALILDGSST